MDATQAAQVVQLLNDIKPILEDIRYILLFGMGLMVGAMCGITFWITMRGAS